MRLARLAVASVAATASWTLTMPAQAAGSLTSACAYQPGSRVESSYSGTMSSGWAIAADDTSPEIVCTVQPTPQPWSQAYVTMAARGLACVQSTCKGDYWVCYQSYCKGNGWICIQSTCTRGGSVCYQSACGLMATDVSPRATRMHPSAVTFTAQPGPLFACTIVRWHRGDTVASETFHGCQPIA